MVAFVKLSGAIGLRSEILAQPTKIKRAVIELICLICIKENIFGNLDNIFNSPGIFSYEFFEYRLSD